MLYTYNKETLSFESKGRDFFIKLFSIILLLSLISFSFGFYLANGIEKTIEYVEYSPPVDLRQEYIDSMFNDYQKRAEIYLSREMFKDSPMKPYMLTSAAKDAYLTTGVFVPIELALAQAQIESNMGRKGRSPMTNPFNIGEYDSYTANFSLSYKNTYDGIRAYYHFMSENYLKCKNVDDLLKQFTNCNHLRYASNKDYETKIGNQINYIRSYIENCIK